MTSSKKKPAAKSSKPTTRAKKGDCKTGKGGKGGGKKKPSTVQKKKVVVKRTPTMTDAPWTEVEDYFLKGHRLSLSVDELAGKLNRSSTEVEKRLNELPIDIIADKLAGFQTHGTGVVAMTGQRSKQDDMRSRQAENKPRDREQKFTSTIWKS